MNASPVKKPPDNSVPEELKRLTAEKSMLAKEVAQAEGKEMLPEFQNFLAAAERGDWNTARTIFHELTDRISRGETSAPQNICRHGSQWSAVFEIAGAFEQLTGPDAPQSIEIGKMIVASIPPGSIYFGGTDPGRLVITALSRSHRMGDPFFTLTQNSLVDKGYLEYARRIYGKRISLPSEEDQTNAFEAYADDFERRRREIKLQPGESIAEQDGRGRFINQASMMFINGILAKKIVDRNPDREFFIEESFPLRWMRVHLSPHGLILKIHREPLPVLSDAIIKENDQYWINSIQPLLGGWFRNRMPLREMAAHVEKQRATPEQAGTPTAFVNSIGAQMWLSKLRSAIAGVYARRGRTADHPAEKERMLRASECALQEAWALCPRSPEALHGYAGLLVDQGRIEEAMAITGVSRKLEPDNHFFASLETELKKRIPGAA